jgi:CDP-diacylglycerol--glycerol-3-phosphate 3-phosphatidyltransferase
MTEKRPANNVELSRLLGRFWTIPNLLSLARLILVVPVVYLILEEGSLVWLFGLLLLLLMTDWFDGRVARWSKSVSDWGKVLDPLADKVAAAAIVLALVVRDSLPLWFLSVIVARDSAIVLGGVVLARRTGQVVMSVWMGKVAVTALSFTVLAALMRADAPILNFCIWVATGLLVYSFILYAIRWVRLMRTGSLPEDIMSSTEGDQSVGSMRHKAGHVS